MEDFRLNKSNSDWDKFKRANPSIVAIYNTIVKDQLLSVNEPTSLDSIENALRYHYNYSNHDVTEFIEYIKNENMRDITFGEPYHGVHDDSLYFKHGSVPISGTAPAAVAVAVPVSHYPKESEQQ